VHESVEGIDVGSLQVIAVKALSAGYAAGGVWAEATPCVRPRSRAKTRATDLMVRAYYDRCTSL